MPNEPRKRYVSTIVEVEGRDERKVVETPAFDVAPWTDQERLGIVGVRAARVDAPTKVAGRATYTSDVSLPGMLHAVIVRAPLGPGRVERLDVAAARAVPGVVDVITADDLTRPTKFSGIPLFDPAVLYAGQPVAAVCAESREAAAAGAAALAPIVPSSTPVLDPIVKAANDEADVVERGDVERGLKEADVLVRREYRTPSQLHSALEPHGAVAQYDGDRLTIWESTQGVFRVRDEVARAMAMPRSAVRVLMDHMGGGFGAKNHAGPHTVAAALFAQRTGKPVRCVLAAKGSRSTPDTGPPPSSKSR